MKPSRVRWICSGLSRLVVVPAVLATALLTAPTASAELYTTTATTTNWDSARWSANPSGAFNNAWVSGSNASFQTAGNYVFQNLTVNSTLTLGNITTAANANISFTSSSGKTINFAGNSTTIDTGAGSFVNLGGLNTGISGAALAITKTGAGILALNGGPGSSFTGGFTLDGGTVITTSTNALGGGTLTIGANGGTIGSGRLTAGTVNLKDFSQRVTGINLNGDLQLGTSATNAFNSSAASMTFGGMALGGTGDRTITIGSSGSQTFNGVISGTNLLKFTSVGVGANGAINLSGANTYSGGTLISDALVQVSGNNSVLGTGTVGLAGDVASQLKINSSVTLANNFTIANSTGVKTISNFGSDATLSGNILNNETDAGQFIIGAGSGRIFEVSGNISGTGGLRIGGAGLDGIVVLSGNNTYAGTTEINIGTLQLGSATAIPASANSELGLDGNGTLDLNGFNATFNEIVGNSGTVLSIAAPATLTLGANDTTSTLNAALGDGSSNLNLDKIGTGELRLASAFNSAGTATVSAGTLELTGAGVSGSIVVGSAGTLRGDAASGTESIDGDLTVNGTIDLRGATLAQSMSAANITLGSGTTQMSILDGTDYSSLDSLGTLDYGNGNLVLTYDAVAGLPNLTTFNLFTFGALPSSNFASITTAGTGEFSSVTFIYDANRGNWYSTNPTVSSDRFLVFTPSTGSLVIVPEPSTWAMTLTSVGFAGWMARRKKLALNRRMA